MHSVVISHAGRRDQYELAIAFEEAGLLQCLVTDTFFKNPEVGIVQLISLLGLDPKLRFHPELRAAHVQYSFMASAFVFGEKIFKRNNWLRIAKGYTISRLALREAIDNNAILFTYSHSGGHRSFRRLFELKRPRLLFQMHPSAEYLKNLFLEEIELVPAARLSLNSEVEVASRNISNKDLECEVKLASRIAVASSFTRHTLISDNVPEDKIRVIPYGVVSRKLSSGPAPISHRGPLQIAFVGALIQRKGLSYLLQAVRQFPPNMLELTLFTRDFVDTGLMQAYAGDNVKVIRGLNDQDLFERLKRYHLFTLPSLAEGFGLVILEAMSCGLPVLATPNTAAADVIEDRKSGFIVPIRDIGAIVNVFEWALSHRSDLEAMRHAAYMSSQQWTWPRFRAGIRQFYYDFVNEE